MKISLTSKLETELDEITEIKHKHLTLTWESINIYEPRFSLNKIIKKLKGNSSVLRKHIVKNGKFNKKKLAVNIILACIFN